MSVETWKTEYYPTPADSPELDTDEKRILHSLKKFEGARPEALERHGVEIHQGQIFDIVETFDFDCDSCSLCIEYLLIDNDEECEGCPLYEQGDQCDLGKDPFTIFLQYKNPEPMIAALNKALEKARGK